MKPALLAALAQVTLGLAVSPSLSAQQVIGPDASFQAEQTPGDVYYGQQIAAGDSWFSASGRAGHGADLYERVGGEWVITLHVPSPSFTAAPGILVAGDRAVSTGAASVAFQVWERVGGVWTHAEDVPTIPGSPGVLGISEFTGTRLVLANPAAAIAGPHDGVVQVWELEGGSWLPKQTLYGSLMGHRERFGASVCLNGDDLFIGAPTSYASQTSGRVYVFHHDGAQFVHEATLRSPDTQGWNRFGNALTVAGGELLVACTLEHRLWRWARAGGTWVSLGDLPAPFTFIAPDFSFAWGWVLEGHGDRLLVGNYPSTSVYEYALVAGDWEPQRVLLPRNPAGNANSLDVAIGSDFTVLAQPGARVGLDYVGRVSLYGHGSSALGTLLCAGTAAAACPCGHAPGLGAVDGCLDSYGALPHLALSGSASLSAGDLSVILSGLSSFATNHTLGAAPAWQPPTVVGGGLLCLAAPFQRVATRQGAGAEYGRDLLGTVGASVGETWLFQATYRTISSACPGPFFTAAVAVTVEP